MTRVPETSQKTAQSAVRANRLATALRENLRRRKAQARGRGAEPEKPTRAGPVPEGEKKR